jgi:hypothetical protein
MSPATRQEQGRRSRPRHLSHLRHLDLCPDCQCGVPCRMEIVLAKRADIEDGHIYGWPADARGSR